MTDEIALELKRGDTAFLDITAVEPDGQPTDLSASLIWWTAKYRTTDDDDRAVFFKTRLDGIDVTDPLNGVCSVRIDPSDWEEYGLGHKPLVWDLQISVPGVPEPTVVTLSSGTLSITPDVTRAFE